MNLGEFKAAANEVGGWVWGAVAGNFNEKQTIGQVLTDAVISMFPVAGEVTAARDVIAVSIRLAQEPKKREEVAEWVMLVLPLLALVPLLGGALKGIGRLLLRVGKSADEDRKVLQACVWLLNRIGDGNALRFVRELDFARYAAPLRNGADEVLSRLANGVDFLRRRFQSVIPEAVAQRMEALKVQIVQLRVLADRMVPQALKDLNNRLKAIQRLAYEGEWHLIPGSGKAITRETEARLVHDVERGEELWKLEGAKWPQNTEEMFVPRDNWPNMTEQPTTSVKTLATGDQLIDFHAIAAFSGPITAREIKPGMVIYRVVEARPTSRAEGVWWTAVDPRSITGWYWRVKYAVMQSWSRNGKYVKYVVHDRSLHAWEGKASGQIDQAKKLRDGSPNPTYGQYLEGGETQLYIDFTHPSNEHALAEVKSLTKQDTNWLDHMNINVPAQGATVQELGRFVEEQKSLASANLATAANQASHAASGSHER